MAQGGRIAGIDRGSFMLEQQKQNSQVLQEAMSSIMDAWKQEKQLKEMARATDIEATKSTLESFRQFGTASGSYVEVANSGAGKLLLGLLFKNMRMSKNTSDLTIAGMASGEVNPDQFSRAAATWSSTVDKSPDTAEQAYLESLAKSRAEGGETGPVESKPPDWRGSFPAADWGKPSEEPPAKRASTARGTAQLESGVETPAAAPAPEAAPARFQLDRALPTARVPTTQMEAEKATFGGLAPGVENLPRVNVDGVENVDNYWQWGPVSKITGSDENPVASYGGVLYAGTATQSPLDLAHGWLERVAHPDGPFGGTALTGKDIPEEVKTKAQTLLDEIKSGGGKDDTVLNLALAGAQAAGATDEELRSIAEGGYSRKLDDKLNSVALPDVSVPGSIDRFLAAGASIRERISAPSSATAPAPAVKEPVTPAVVAAAMEKPEIHPQVVAATSTLDEANGIMDQVLKMIGDAGETTPQALAKARVAFHNYDKYQRLLGMGKKQVDSAFESLQTGPLRDYLERGTPAETARIAANLALQEANTQGGKLKAAASILSSIAETQTAQARMSEAGASLAATAQAGSEEAKAERARALEIKRLGIEMDGKVAELVYLGKQEDVKKALIAADVKAQVEAGKMTDADRANATVQENLIRTIGTDLGNMIVDSKGVPKDISAWKDKDVALYNGLREKMRAAYQGIVYTVGSERKRILSDEAVENLLPLKADTRTVPRNFLFIQWEEKTVGLIFPKAVPAASTPAPASVSGTPAATSTAASGTGWSPLTQGWSLIGKPVPGAKPAAPVPVSGSDEYLRGKGWVAK